MGRRGLARLCSPRPRPARAEANFVATKSSDLLSKWYGESEQQIARLFNRARQVAPTIIFIDELDSLVPARGGGLGEPQVTERVVNTILAEMDGLEELQNVVVIGATNRPTLIDPALLRPGRFDELIYVGTPDAAGRRRILAIHTRDMPLADDVDLESLAKRAERFTGADLEDLVRRAGLTALRRGLDAAKVTMADFEVALTETRASVTPEMLEEYGKHPGYAEERSHTAARRNRIRASGMLHPQAGREGKTAGVGAAVAGEAEQQQCEGGERQIVVAARTGDPDRGREHVADPVRGGDHARNRALLGQRNGERSAGGEARAGEAESQ